MLNSFTNTQLYAKSIELIVVDLLSSASKPSSSTDMQKLSTIDKVRGMKSISPTLLRIPLTDENTSVYEFWRLHLKFGPDKNKKPKKVSLFCQSITLLLTDKLQVTQL